MWCENVAHDVALMARQSVQSQLLSRADGRKPMLALPSAAASVHGEWPVCLHGIPEHCPSPPKTTISCRFYAQLQIGWIPLHAHDLQLRSQLSL